MSHISKVGVEIAQRQLRSHPARAPHAEAHHDVAKVGARRCAQERRLRCPAPAAPSGTATADGTVAARSRRRTLFRCPRGTGRRRHRWRGGFGRATAAPPAAHCVLDPTRASTEAPLHWAFSPQVLRPPRRRTRRPGPGRNDGTAPLGRHLDLFFRPSKAAESPSQASSQHTLSTQEPVPHLRFRSSRALPWNLVARRCWRRRRTRRDSR